MRECDDETTRVHRSVNGMYYMPEKQRFQYLLAEDGVFPIEMSLLGIGDEELGLVCVRPRVGHSNDTACVELYRKGSIVEEFR